MMVPVEKARRTIAAAHRARRLAIVAGCLLGAGCTSASFVPEPVRFDTKDWSYRGVKGVELATRHYTIYTTCRSRSFVNALPGFMEDCYQAYSELLPTAQAPAEPMPTYLFQKRWEWERFTEEFTPDRASTYKAIREGGYSERGVTVSYYGRQRSTLSILAHEGLHQYLETTKKATNRHRIPAWVNEGLACYFESLHFEPSTGRPIHTPANNTLRRPRLREALVSDTLLPLREVLSTHAGHVVLERRQYVQACYAQWWSLVLFLVESEAQRTYGTGFRALLEEMGTDALQRRARAYLAADSEDEISFGEAVFRAYITDDLDAFDSAYRAYLHELLELRAM